MITNYVKRRQIFYAFLACVLFVLPFVRIGDNHFFLLSFDHKKLHLFFTEFNTNELYLMPFLLIMMFVFIFFITNMLGRVWCAWGCPQTMLRMIFRDFLQTKIFKIYGSRKNKQNPPRKKLAAKIASVVIFYFIALLVASNFMWFFVPPEDFFAYLQRPSEHLILLGIIICLSTFITFDITYMKENFCAYVCPYARIQSVMFDTDTKIVIYDEGRGGVLYKNNEKITKKPLGGECIGCEACVKVCPAHIDIRKGMQLECINCLECADACSGVQNRFNRPSLISWASTKQIKSKEKFRFFRAKSIAYIVVLCVMLLGLIIKAGNKETMLLNINRTSELYTIKDGGKSVENAYLMLFHNTDNKAHKFYLEVLGSDEISIVKPKKEFLIPAGAKDKQVVILKSHNERSHDELNKTIKIHAFAIDNPQISTQKQTFFIYPKGD